MVRLSTRSESETELIGARLARHLVPGSVIALTGPLGSGKSVIVRGLARALGIREPVLSPTFTIVSEYEADVPLVHVDLFRTSSDAELELMGLDEIMTSRSIIAVEWADKASTFLPAERIDIVIEMEGDERHLYIEGVEIDGSFD